MSRACRRLILFAEDRRNAEVTIANTVNTHELGSNAKTVRVALIASYDTCTACRGAGTDELAALLLDVFGSEEELAKHKKSITEILTKAPFKDEDLEPINISATDTPFLHCVHHERPFRI